MQGPGDEALEVGELLIHDHPSRRELLVHLWQQLEHLGLVEPERLLLARLELAEPVHLLLVGLELAEPVQQEHLDLDLRVGVQEPHVLYQLELVAQVVLLFPLTM